MDLRDIPCYVPMPPKSRWRKGAGWRWVPKADEFAVSVPQRARLLLSCSVIMHDRNGYSNTATVSTC